jgi:hypothetical protein
MGSNYWGYMTKFDSSTSSQYWDSHVLLGWDELRILQTYNLKM